MKRGSLSLEALMALEACRGKFRIKEESTFTARVPIVEIDYDPCITIPIHDTVKTNVVKQLPRSLKDAVLNAVLQYADALDSNAKQIRQRAEELRNLVDRAKQAKK